MTPPTFLTVLGHPIFMSFIEIRSGRLRYTPKFSPLRFADGFQLIQKSFLFDFTTDR